ncbi:MAG: efflux RND transporter permease subunit [Alphaproteobacteria bacterium]|nr:MAG: efflux RND transporter permease subunit [Alphaproteobacteria bacterium]
MNALIEISLKRPMAVMAGVLMIVAFGLVSLQTIPIQLTPDVRRPVIDIRTNWRGEAPVDVEREVTNRLEEELGGIEGVVELTSRSRFGQSRIRLEFEVGYDLDKGMLLINNRLSGVDDLPREADEPRMDSRGSEDIPIAYFALRRKPGNTREMETYGDLIEDVIVDRIERVSGVSGAGFRGGSRRELRIVVDPEKMAYYRLTIPDILKKMRDASASLSAGEVEEGKRRYLVRTEGEIRTVRQAKAVVLIREQDNNSGRVGRVTVGDIADVVYGYKDRTSYRRYLGEDVITLQAFRDSGANVIKTMDAIRAVIDDLNENALARENLYITWIYDETVYIKSALALVTQNIWLGGILAALILMLFLRSWRPTLVVMLAIPVSIIGAFVAMAMLGRSINVISLAGIAFAVGMVVDAAIVVLENIYRHRELGKSPLAAALEGTKEVWPAVFASALTTVVVFAPILMLKLQVGQLFRDIAVALSVAVMLSLIVSVTVIPTLSRKLLTKVGKGGAGRFAIPGVDHFARWFVRVIMGFTGIVVRSKLAAFAVVCTVVGGTALFTAFAMPPLDFLPDGNKNFVWGHITPPPGYNLKTMKRVAEEIEKGVKPYWASLTGPESKPGEPPKIKHFFFVARSDRAYVGASAVDPARAGELEDLIEKPVLKEPGTRASIRQSSIFSRGIGGSRSIRFDISGPDLEVNIDVARRADEIIREVLPRSEGHRVRPRPGLEMGAPEIRIIPDQSRLADAGLSARDFAQTIDAFNDGIRIAEITIGNRRIDLSLAGPKNMVTETQGIGNLPVVTRDGRIVPASSLAEIKITAGPTQVWHLERIRYVTLQIRPSKLIPLETTIERLRKEVLEPMRAEGLPDGVKIRLSGAADNLTKTWNALKFDMLVALAIVFLVMAVILESFLYPLIIMLSVPLATAGGMLGLWVLNTVVLPATDRQPLDMLTILGFIILIGTVVNNAILLVTYTVQNVRARGMTPEQAILNSTKTRIRPVFMSTLTTVFGMLPLVVAPGAGSELYRGLGAVVIGGLALSALLTLMIIPPLLSLLSWKLRTEGKRSEEAGETAVQPAQ